MGRGGGGGSRGAVRRPRPPRAIHGGPSNSRVKTNTQAHAKEKERALQEETGKKCSWSVSRAIEHAGELCERVVMTWPCGKQG